ncbi:hypothetical protein ASPCAL01414 [Aspergillus calidoustus]|uniref:Mid2 domain-containing protein n=1 Tax=Aspergillus calidoustus TaxID=454130 RepID=A0A0U5FTD7_ASPCI|nr:hypothetical protein ASPCAL01414 [Aspergillus calidoustus]
MMGLCIFFLLAGQLLGAGSASASASAVGDPPLRTVRAADDTAVAVKRALNSAAGTTYTLNQTHLTKSWADATLFSLGIGSSTTNNSTGTEQSLDLEGALTVTCTACYINGSVTGTVNITNDFNVTDAVSSLSEEVLDMTSLVLGELSDFVTNTTDVVLDAVTDFDFDGIDLPAWPTLNLEFNLNDTEGLPDVHAQFEFTDLELYLELDVVLSAGATYTLNLFTSQSVAGIKIPGLEAGALFKVDLVLIAEAEIDISSGFHVKLDQGLVLDFALFDEDVGGVTLPGGLLEFLPVTITGAGSLRALLQITASIGFELATLDNIPGIDFSTGVSAEVFAYVADLHLSVDATTDDEAECALEAVAAYTLAVGAAAGATVAVDTYNWGPAPTTTVPVWYTTLASVCAVEKSSTTITSAASPNPSHGLLEERQRNNNETHEEMTTTTLTSSTKYTVVGCRLTGQAICPASLQTTTATERTMTAVVTVESGVTPSFPERTHSTLSGAIPFGANVRKLPAVSGPPVSYVPPRETGDAGVSGNSSGDGDMDDDDDGDGNDEKLIIGLSVGLGCPMLIGVAAGVWWFVHRRKKYASVPQSQSETTVYSPWQGGAKSARATVAAAAN